MVATITETKLSVDQLLLDPNNFRFQDEDGYVRADPDRFAETTVQERAARRIRAEGIAELKNSILSNGFLAVERLVVRLYRERVDAPPLYLVLEGNRRLAALKSIQQDHQAGLAVPDSVLAVLDAVPVVIIDSDDDEGTYLAIMGIRHVGGIKQWGGYQRAKLVADLRDLHQYDTTDVADRLGMTKQEVNRRYRALKALQQMQDDEEFADYANSSMYQLFHEAVSLPTVRSWLGWDDADMCFKNLDTLRQFYELIAPHEDREDDEGDSRISPKITTYSQVRDLRTILPNAEASLVLLDPKRSLNDALAIAKAEELSKTWKSQVAEASGALLAIGALELANLSPEELEIIKRVQDVATQLLASHQKLVRV